MSDQVRDIREPGWMWADRDIVKRDGPKLGPHGIAVYIALCSFAGDDQRAWPSKQTLAKLVGCSKRQVSYSVSKLEELGWIEIERRPTGEGKRHETNIYYLLPKPGGSAPHALHSAPGAIGVVHPMHGGSAPHAPERKPLNDTQERETPQPFDGFLAYCRGLDIEPKTVPKTGKAKECRYAKEILDAGYSLEEIEGCTRELKAQAFWQDKPLSLASVGKELPQWKQRGNGNSTIRM